MVYIPAKNAITAQLGEEPEYPEESSDKRYIILYPEDYQGHGSDVKGNVALLVNRENAEEIKRLAEQVIDEIDSEDENQETL